MKLQESMDRIQSICELGGRIHIFSFMKLELKFSISFRQEGRHQISVIISEFVMDRNQTSSCHITVVEKLFELVLSHSRNEAHILICHVFLIF